MLLSSESAAILQVSLEVALLDERPITVLAMKWSIAAVHANVSFDAEKLGVCPPTIVALEDLVGPESPLVPNQDFLVAPVHLVVFLS